MNYATLELAISKDEARAIIAEHVDGVHIRESRGDYEFRSPTGFHLAAVSDLSLPNGEQGARLKYRTSMISPVAALARSKARRIKTAVEKHRYQNR